MSSYFSAEFFTANRKQLRKKVKGGAPIIVASHGLLQRGGDSTYAFSQDAYFWYLTGISEPDLILVMASDETYLIVPPRDATRAAFDGAIDNEDLKLRSGVDEVYEETAGWAKLKKTLHQIKEVATLSPPLGYIDRYGFYTNPARRRLIARLKAVQHNMKFTDITKQLVRQRMIKQAPELDAIQRAIDITIESLKVVSKPEQLSRYKYEYELEADLSREFRFRGAEGHSFDPIVAGGKRACILHNVANDAKLTPGELIVLDVGAEYEHYAADITRTVCARAPSERQLAVHEAVKTVQQQAFDYLKPGVGMRDFEQKVEVWIGQQLIRLGLIKELEHSVIREYYPHATSHFMGLNVHDVGDYEVPLEEGMVITVEPGIYIPEEGIGVRIEDDVLITKQGIKILTDGLSRDLKA